MASEVGGSCPTYLHRTGKGGRCFLGHSEKEVFAELWGERGRDQGQRSGSGVGGSLSSLFSPTSQQKLQRLEGLQAGQKQAVERRP